MFNYVYYIIFKNNCQAEIKETNNKNKIYLKK